MSAAGLCGRARVLLLDVEGTTTSLRYVQEKLFPYAEENVKTFLESCWEQAEVQEAVAALRKLSLEDQEKKVDGAVAIPAEDASKEEQIEGLVNSVKWQMSSDRKAGPLKSLQGLIWQQGYDKGDLQGHVFEDVAPALQQWVSEEDHKIYIYSSGSVQAQKLIYGKSIAGDLLPHIAGHFDTAVGGKQEAASYKNILEKIGCEAVEVLFLTDILAEATAASEAGLSVALVSRPGNAPLPDDVSFPVMHSFSELATSKKRKIEAQDEQPTKIAKTDSKETESPAAAEVTTEPAMEVDSATEKTPETTPQTDEKTEVKEEEVKTEEKVDIVVEKVTEKEKTGEPVVDIELTVVKEKSTDPETEVKTEEPSVESKTEATKEDVKKPETGKEESMEAEETPPVTVEDITDKKEEVIENIDIDPIIEEPPETVLNEDMVELQNVADVLDKECDDILSKVSEVTNLESIPVKPIMETVQENGKTVEAAEEVTEKVVEAETIEVKETKEEVKELPVAVKEIEKTEIVNVSPEETPKATECSTEPSEKATNGDAKEKSHVNGTTESKDKVNGESKNGDERLSGEEKENGEKRLNGTNGKGPEETEVKVAEAAVPEIIVKSVPTAGHTEPVDQPTEA